MASQSQMHSIHKKIFLKDAINFLLFIYRYFKHQLTSCTRYKGDWSADLPAGSGEYHWNNGNQYIGQFRSELVNGGRIFKLLRTLGNGHRCHGIVSLWAANSIVEETLGDIDSMWRNWRFLNHRRQTLCVGEDTPFGLHISNKQTMWQLSAGDEKSIPMAD